ncbi:hypothetical protein HW509_09205 [Asaia spathodeae]|uniref:DUF5694 domain-containing protein n=1 Tax=Asaia spathodeae TaxID=657016 RepID=UPI002FC39474
MKRIVRAFILVALMGLHPVRAQPYHPSFHPEALNDSPAGRHNDVLVLGSPHLSGLTAPFSARDLDPVMGKLAAWHPDVIVTESSSGLLCEWMRRRGERLAASVERYCPDPSPAGKAVGLTVVQANDEADRLLADWPQTPSPAQRRRLALIFLAAGEPNSAVVQWLRLPPAERRNADGLTIELVDWLTLQTTRRNESVLIGARLAARLGLERVWGMDDQNFAGMAQDEKAYGAALQQAWNNPATKARLAQDKRLDAQLGTVDGWLTLYRAYNAPGYAMEAYRSDWGAALREPSRQGYGRQYVGYWETRNLRMVANIRELLTRAPGSRLLVIVGASHKAYCEAYLDQMRDVDLVDAEAVLH